MKLLIANSKRNAQNAIIYSPQTHCSPIIHFFFVIGIIILKFMRKCVSHLYIFIFILVDFASQWPGGTNMTGHL